MIEGLPVDRHLQFVRIGPVGLKALAQLMHLREENFLGRPVAAQPVGHPPLERPQGPPVGFARMGREQMLEQRLGLHLRALLEPPLGLWPDLHQWIASRPPQVWLLQGLRTSVRRQIPHGRLPMHACFHGRVVNHAALLELVH